MNDAELRRDLENLIARRRDREEQRERAGVGFAVDVDGAGQRSVDRDGAIAVVKRRGLSLVVTIAISAVLLVLLGLLYQRSAGIPVVGATVVTYTPTVAVQAAPTAIARPAVQVVEVQPLETESDRIIMEILHQLTTAVDNLAAEVDASTRMQESPVEVVAQVSQDASRIGSVRGEPVSLSEPTISVWEDGTCWTPATATVLHLCGADEADGYVVRWVGVAGDNPGPEIPDADYLATRSGGDRLVWSGVHPATGDAVTVDYWSGGHVLAVRSAGHLLFRIDRGHGVVK